MLASVCSTHVHSHGYLQIALSAIVAVASALAVTTHHQVHAGTRLTAANLRRDSAHRSGICDSALGLDSQYPHLRHDCAWLCHICARPGSLRPHLRSDSGSPLPHLRPDRVHRCQTCAGTRLNCSHVYAGTRAHCCHICPGTPLTAASPLGLGSETQLPPDSFLFD